MGPLSSGAAVDTGADLVEDMAQARLLWTSQERLPDGRTGDARTVLPKNETNVSGGCASPVVSDGRVYFFYYVPSGEVFDEEIAKRHEAGGGYGKEKWYIDADDIILCLDASSGKTLWKTVYQGKGLNYNAFNKGGPQLTPCVAGGRVFALGTAGRVYGADARTGAPLWESTIGPRAELLEKVRQASRKDRKLLPFNRDLSSSPVVAAGVVVVNDHQSYRMHRQVGSGLVGFDAATGRRLWTVPECAGHAASPVLWRHKGREYIICGNDTYYADERKVPRVVCVDPSTGRLLWEMPAGQNRETMVVAGDCLVCNGSKDAPAVVAYRLAPERAVKAWGLPPALGYPGERPPVIYRGHVYVAGRNGQLACVDLGSGKIAASVPFGGGGASFMVAAEGRLLVQVDASHARPEVRLFKADPKDFRELGAVWMSPAAASYTTAILPAIVDGRMYLRTSDRIVCYDLRKAPAP
jgi:outer membrane protein assembly factor BamB